MEDAAKNRIMMILVIVGLIFFLLWIGANTSLNKQRQLAVSKGALSMDLEEKNARLEKDKSSLTEELKNTQAQLAEEKKRREEVKLALSQEQIAAGVFKVELERLTKLKETLEEDLKEALEAKKK